MHFENTAADVVEQDTECPLFTLALTNNLELLYQITNKRKKWTSCFQTMFSTMMYLLDSNDASDHHPEHDHEHKGSSSSSSSDLQSRHQQEWNGLFSNVMTILFPHTYEMAAAAA